MLIPKLRAMSEADLVSISIPTETLVKDLRVKSLTTISDALEFSLRDGSRGQKVSVKLSLFVGDTLAGEQIVKLDN